MANRFILPFADVGAGIVPADGAQLFFSDTGTSFDDSPKNTFSDAAGTIPNPNPVIADSNGLFPDIWIEGDYKVVCKDKNDIQKWEADPVISGQQPVNSYFLVFDGDITYIDSTSFLAEGNQVSLFTTGSRLRITDTMTLYASVRSAVLTGDDTTVTIQIGIPGGSLTPSLSLVETSILTTIEKQVSTQSIAMLDTRTTMGIVYELHDKLLDLPVNVKPLGVFGDGVTDDMANLNKITDALNLLPNKHIHLEAGTFIVNDDAKLWSVDPNNPNTGLRLYSNFTLSAQRGATILKMIDGAPNAANVVRCESGPDIPWQTETIRNVTIRDLTIDGNKQNHVRLLTVSDGVTVASSNIVTSVTGGFDVSMVGKFLFMDFNRSSFSISAITPDGLNTRITARGNDFKVGERITFQSIAGDTQFTDMNGMQFVVDEIVLDATDRQTDIVIAYQITAGAHTPGTGVVIGGRNGYAITGVTDTYKIVTGKQ